MKREVVVVASMVFTALLAGTLFSSVAFGGGNPILETILKAIHQFESRIDSLNATVREQQQQISELQSQVGSLNASLLELEKRIRALEPPEPELVGYWSFSEETGATVRDSSGNDNHGTIYGATWIDGKIGKALNFDGIDDYIEVPDDPTLHHANGVTVGAWVKIDGTTSDHQVIASRWSPAALEYVLEFRPDGITPQFVLSNYRYAVSSVAIPFGSWAHIVGTYDGNTMKIYVNGTLTGSLMTSGMIDVLDQPLCIGSHSPANIGDRNWFNGIIDEARIYNGALSAEDIEALYQL